MCVVQYLFYGHLVVAGHPDERCSPRRLHGDQKRGEVGGGYGAVLHVHNHKVHSRIAEDLGHHRGGGEQKGPDAQHANGTPVRPSIVLIYIKAVKVPNTRSHPQRILLMAAGAGQGRGGQTHPKAFLPRLSDSLRLESMADDAAAEQ